jgi:hypothetical protein
MLNLSFITCQPDQIIYAWQTRVQINNFRKYDYAKLLNVLVLMKSKHKPNKIWLDLVQEFPKVTFHFYEDNDEIYTRYIKPTGYESLCRPYLMQRYFEEYPGLKEAAIFYLDSDALFTNYLDFDKYLYDDNTCYLSDTISYIGYQYFDSKINQVLPERLERYKGIDVLNSCMRYFNLNRNDAVLNETGSGGAQYLLKNIDARFWKEVFDGAVYIKGFLSAINKEYFENESKGYQSFCSDMWSLLFTLWSKGMNTECPKDLDFAWSTDPVNLIEEKKIYHDAGMSCPCHNGFMKQKYRTSEPVDVKAIDFNPSLCTSWYAKQIENSYGR